MGPFFKLPEYFRTHTQEDLYDLKKSPYAWAVGMEGSTYYEAISASPKMLHCFNFTMATSEKITPILGMFPFSSMKEAVEADPSRPFAVDIGGGRGHFLLAIQREEAPNGFGAKMILQDRPDVLASLKPEDIPNIEAMPYDFFTPQPVKSKQRPVLYIPLPKLMITRCTLVSDASYPPRLLFPSMRGPGEKRGICNGTYISLHHL